VKASTAAVVAIMLLALVIVQHDIIRQQQSTVTLQSQALDAAQRTNLFLFCYSDEHKSWDRCRQQPSGLLVSKGQVTATVTRSALGENRCTVDGMNWFPADADGVCRPIK
jgi:hypothetical protein